MRYQRLSEQQNRAPKEFIIDCGIASYERFDSIVSRATSLRSPSIRNSPFLRSPSLAAPRSGSQHDAECSGAVPVIEPTVTPATGMRKLLLSAKDAKDTSTPRRDEGRAASLVLIAAILFRSAILGIPQTYGVFQAHYTTLFPGNTSAVWIGVLSNGLRFVGAPIITYFCSRFHFKIQRYQVVGWALCVSALYISIWMTSLPGLILSQGLLFGLGAIFVDAPTMIMINTWYEKRRGVAYGLILSGADTMGLGYMFLVTYLLGAQGLRITMSVLTAIVFWLGGPAILLLRKHPVELPQPQSRGASRASTLVNKNELDYYKRPVYYLLSAMNFLQSLSLYLPFIYLPSFSNDLGNTHFISALVLATTNFGSIAGQNSFGPLSDFMAAKFLIVISTTGTSLATFGLWGILAPRSTTALFCFAFVFGWFGSGFQASWARIGMLFGERDTQIVYSTLMFGRGISVVLSGPVSSILLAGAKDMDLGQYAAAKYTPVVLFVQYCMAAAASIGVIVILALWFEHSFFEIKFQIKKRPTSEQLNALPVAV